MNTQVGRTADSARMGIDAVNAILLAAVGIALVTGLALLPFYQATPSEAHRAVVEITHSAPLRLVRAVHHWASAVVILTGGLTIFHGLLGGAYRRPRQFVWIATISLVVTGLLLQLTGHLLPWDIHAVRTTVIETGIAANAPVVGAMQARLLRGGNAVGPQTLSLWYLAHVAALPIAALVLLGLVLTPMVRPGARTGAAKWHIGAVLGLMALMALALKPPLGPAATPADYGSYDAPPEWYVLPLHSLLVLFQNLRPDLAFIGTLVIPGLALALLMALPWLDRTPTGASPRRWTRVMAGVGGICFVLLIARSASNMAPLVAGQVVGQQEAGRKVAEDSAAPRPMPIDPLLITAGKSVYTRNGCAGCHQIDAQGGSVGPPLNGTGSRHPDRDWQMRHLKTPSSVVSGSTMPPYAKLSDADLKALASYLLSLK